jgi:hypothetical protein
MMADEPVEIDPTATLSLALTEIRRQMLERLGNPVDEADLCAIERRSSRLGLPGIALRALVHERHRRAHDTPVRRQVNPGLERSQAVPSGRNGPQTRGTARKH